jgi:hypothetical protein
MGKDQAYGIRVDVEDISAVLFSTRVMRLALEVMWNRMTEDMRPERVSHLRCLDECRDLVACFRCDS